MNRKIRVGAVSYLNTKPLIYGFNHGKMKDDIDLVVEYPSIIASMLLKDDIDVGLVPVSIIPLMKEHYIISDYCIGCNGEVGSVCLFSETPLEKIENILLDYQSRTSVELLKILVRSWWRIDPKLSDGGEDFREHIKGTTAGLVIGDRALEQRKTSTYHYDLGLEWKKFTGLPFVFAAWVSNKKLDPTFITAFNDANSYGLGRIDEVAAENESRIFDLKSYYTTYINYNLGNKEMEGLRLFLKMLDSGDPERTVI